MAKFSSDVQTFPTSIPTPARTQNRSEEEKRKAGEDKRKAEIAQAIAYSTGLFMTAVTMVVPTRAPMVFQIKNEDAAGTAKIMGLMSSTAAITEVFTSPMFGRLSDKYGRKPFLLLAPAIDAALHILVAMFPRKLAVTFVDRMITGAMIFAFIAPGTAALSDLYEGQELAIKIANNGKYFGIGCALGPFLGAKLGGAKSFLASAALFLVTWFQILSTFTETLTVDGKKDFDFAACSPLRFLKLFQNKVMGVLATTIGLQSFGDYVNIYDINFLYLKTQLGYGQSEVGNFATAVGISQILGGDTMTRIIRNFGQRSATLFSNISWTFAMLLLGTSRSASGLLLTLIAATNGHQRATCASVYLQKHGQAAGMGRAEIAAAQMNLVAVLKVVVPLLYGNIFAWATSKGRNIPGAPYYFIAALTMLAQMNFWRINPDVAPSN